MRSRSGALLAVAALGLALGACSSPKSYIVLNLLSADTQQIADVTSVVVTVTQAPSFSTTLTYPVKGTPLLITNVAPTSGPRNDLSFSFSGARSGTVNIEVKVSNAAGCTVGVAHFSTIIRQGGTGSTVAFLQSTGGCVPVDAGVDAQPTSDATFPGCDPVPPTCAAGQTCQINCATVSAECTPGGARTAGQPCDSNRDCAPGSQCFDYTSTGCNVKLCLRFCNTDDGCGGARDAGADGGTGVGTRSQCQGVVPCNGMATAYHTCTFACDPRLAAASQSGCPTGLSCLIVGDMDQVDCACAGATHVKTDGMDCGSGAECAPGFICNIMGATKTCRAVCRCDVKDGLCTAPNDCAGTKTCTALEHETTFGVCL